MRKTRFVVLVTLILTATLWLTRPVFAHAALLQATPAANSSLERAPAQVELLFSETIEPAFSVIRVLNANGDPVDNSDSRVDPADATRMTVSLRSLPAGVYTVSWRTLSAVDGHITNGAFPFAVGDVDAAALAAAPAVTQDVNFSIVGVVVRWLTYLGSVMLAGGGLFSLLVWQPAYQAVRPQGGRDPFGRLRVSLTGLALIIVVLTTFLDALVQTWQATGRNITAISGSSLYDLLFGTRFGVLWIGRIILLMLFGALLPASPTRRNRWLAFGLALLWLLTLSLGGHAAAEARPAWPVLADWLHMLAASVWVGGLIHLGAGLWSLRPLDEATRTRLTARLLPYFSRLALVSVAILALSGVYAAIQRLGSLDALISSAYGRTLLIKLLIMLPMLGLGALNLLVVTGRLQHAADTDGPTPWSQRFRRSVIGEMTLGVLLLLSVGVLTLLPPPAGAASEGSRPKAGVTVHAEADDLDLTLEVSPGRIGVNTFIVRVAANGQPVNGAREVSLSFTPTAVDIPPSTAQLAAQGNGEYGTQGAYLSLPGVWQIQAAVRRAGVFDAFANFNLDLGAPGADVRAVAWNRWAGGLLLLAAPVCLAVVQSLSRHQKLPVRAAGVLPALLLVWLGVSVFSQTPAALTSVGPINPIAPSVESITVGEALYQANCLSCHGAQGKGDGPVGLTLNPRPADLTIHTIPGVHSDGQLFSWVSGGFPGSVMPAFGTQLTDEERWHIVNYIRTLAAP